jgi:hypothetical protein
MHALMRRLVLQAFGDTLEIAQRSRGHDLLN